MPTYSTRTFLDIVNRLSPSVPGCPTPVIEQYVRDAAIEACERTLAWRYEQPKIRLVPGAYDYAYEAPDDAEVHAVVTATVNGDVLKPITLEQLYDIYPKWPSQDTNERAQPCYITQLDPDNFSVAPIPDDSKTYDARMIVCLKPLRTATKMDKKFLDELENVIMHGALQHLLVLPDRTWSDRELASYHARQFAFKLSERRARTNLGTSKASMRVQAQKFA
jgi:hypothetical protein